MAATPPRKPGPGSGGRERFSNEKTQAEQAMDELKKTAASRGISVEKLIAQMVEQYLKEGKKEKE